MERRSIDELVARYELEPDLADVFVEGPSDRTLIEWVAEEAGISGVAAYEIDTVDVPRTLLTALKLENNNRGRVIGLVQELDRRASTTFFNRVAGLVDGDLDYFDGSVPHSRLLMVTDFTATELYLFSVPAIHKLLRLVLARPSVNAQKVLNAITPILVELFIVRVAARRLGIPLGLVGFEGVCTVKSSGVVFDRSEYIARFIRRAGYSSSHLAFVAEVARLHTVAPTERRHVVHGKDFLRVLRWYCKVVLKIGSVPPEVEFAQALRGCMEFVHLMDTSLVAELRLRFATT